MIEMPVSTSKKNLVIGIRETLLLSLPSQLFQQFHQQFLAIVQIIHICNYLLISCYKQV